MATEDVSTLAARPGWTVGGNVATYEPHRGGWCARVRPVREAGRAYDRFHIAVVDPGGVARYTQFASLLGEAVRVAEGIVRSKPTGDE